jgi:hypothetical protein
MKEQLEMLAEKQGKIERKRSWRQHCTV